MTGIERVGVVVPAHDEQSWIGSCLTALRAAADVVEVPVDIVVVADACSDATVDVVRSCGIEPVQIRARNVGIARAVGWDVVARDPDRARVTWLATTDADTIVPVDWLQRMLDHADDGWDAVVGTVRVRGWAAAGRSQAVQDAWQARYARTRDHVHGANLGIRASCYAAVGGVPARSLAEDAGLVAALRKADARLLHATDLPVLTSARSSSRAPGGFASYLDALGDDVPDGVSDGIGA